MRGTADNWNLWRWDLRVNPCTTPIDSNAKFERVFAKGLRSTPRTPARSVSEYKGDTIPLREGIIEHIDGNAKPPRTDVALLFKPCPQRCRTSRRDGSIFGCGRIFKLGHRPIADISPSKFDDPSVIHTVTTDVADDTPCADRSRHDRGSRVDLRPTV